MTDSNNKPIWVTPKVHKAVKILAAKHETTMTELIRRWANKEYSEL